MKCTAAGLDRTSVLLPPPPLLLLLLLLLELELLELPLLLEDPGGLLPLREAVMPKVPELPTLLGPPLLVLNWILVGICPVKPVLVMHWKHVTCKKNASPSQCMNQAAQRCSTGTELQQLTDYEMVHAILHQVAADGAGMISERGI